MLDDEDIDALRHIADRIRSHADQSSYGYPVVDDPREFTPDLDVCLESELAAHKAACDAWNAGNQVQRAPTHVPFAGGHLTRAPWGVGVSLLQDPDILRLARDLDDIIDRLRQLDTP